MRRRFAPVVRKATGHSNKEHLNTKCYSRLTTFSKPLKQSSDSDSIVGHQKILIEKIHERESIIWIKRIG